MVQGASIALGFLSSFDGQFLHGLADRMQRRPRCDRVAEHDGDGVGNASRDLEEEPPTAAAEDTAPDAIEEHGNDGGIVALDDSLHAPAKGQQHPGTADLTLGKNTDDLARLEAFAGLPHGIEQHPGTGRRGDRNGPDGPHEGLEQAVFEVVGINQETDGPFQGGHDEQAVDERHVVGDEKGASGCGDFVRVQDAQAIDGVRQHAQKQSQQHAWGR